MTLRASRVVVEAPARLHFGMLDLGGSFGRRFGGVGAAVGAPSLVLEASLARDLSAEGPDRERALGFAQHFVAAHGIDAGAHFRIQRALPSHAGLGSGTQLALSVARALAELYQLPNDVQQLTLAVGRSTRSGVGTWAFTHGGLVVEGGRRDGAQAEAPLLARHAMPEAWRCVVVIPDGGQSMSGQAELNAFARLPAPFKSDAERVAHLVLMALIPAVVEGDIETFGRALTELQQINGRWFAHAQGGEFARESAGLVRRLFELGARGVGQSSWGPAVYGVVESDEACARIAAQLRLHFSAGVVFESAFNNRGAVVDVRD